MWREEQDSERDTKAAFAFLRLVHVMLGAQFGDSRPLLSFPSLLPSFSEFAQISIRERQKALSPLFKIVLLIFRRIVQHLFEERMECPADAWPGSQTSDLHDPLTINFQHTDRNRVSQRLVHHRHVFAQPEGVRFRPPGADTVADAQVQEILDILLSYPRYHASDGRERDGVRVGEEHVPPDKRFHFVRQVFREPEICQYLPRHARAYHIVAVEGPIRLLVGPSTGGRLPYIVQERR